MNTCLLAELARFLAIFLHVICKAACAICFILLAIDIKIVVSASWYKNKIKCYSSGYIKMGDYQLYLENILLIKNKCYRLRIPIDQKLIPICPWELWELGNLPLCTSKSQQSQSNSFCKTLHKLCLWGPDKPNYLYIEHEKCPRTWISQVLSC